MSAEGLAALSSLGCVVRATFPGFKDKYSACGIILHPREGILLTHGSILADICPSNKEVLSKIKAGELISKDNLSGSLFTVLLDRCWRPANSPVAHSLTSSRETNQVGANPQSDSFFLPQQCAVLGAFRNQDFHNAVCRIMPEDSWSFASGTQEDSVSTTGSKNASEESGDTSVSFHLLSYFVLLQCDPIVYITGILSTLTSSVLAQNPVRQEKCSIGNEAEIISTPFGGLNPSVFFNSYSKGVISNVSGPNGCWILTDARCIPGSEGGPLFTVESDGARQLAGIVVASLCWKNKEWVGLTLVCGIDSIYKTLMSQTTEAMAALDWKNFDDHFLHSKKYEMQKSMRSAAKDMIAGNESVRFMSRVVLVKVGRVWGSAFVVDPRRGLILTCSHVIKDVSLSDLPILVRAHNSSELFKASVVYRQTSTEITPFDLAVLKCSELMRHLAPTEKTKIVSPSIGQRVLVCGHAVFSTDLGLQPSLSAGVISKVVKIRGQVVMVQSTCAVHGGASGGPLLDTDGNLVGIVVCNTVDKSSNSSYPHINFSIPAISVWPSVQHYIKTGDASMMNSLKVTDSLVKKLWALETSLECDSTVKSKL